MKSLVVIISGCLCLFSCLDPLTDRTVSLGNNLSVVYSAGDGYRLVENASGSNYFNVVPSTLSELYISSKNHFDLLFVKAEPVNSSESYKYYSIQLDTLSGRRYEVNQITDQQYLNTIRSMYKLELSNIK